MEEVIKKAKKLNSDFDKLTIQQQYEFIKGNISRDIIPEDLALYYDNQWNYYPSYLKQRY